VCPGASFTCNYHEGSNQDARDVHHVPRKMAENGLLKLLYVIAHAYVQLLKIQLAETVHFQEVLYLNKWRCYAGILDSVAFFFSWNLPRATDRLESIFSETLQMHFSWRDEALVAVGCCKIYSPRKKPPDFVWTF